jgi:uncharacterized protein (DUF342 family)
MGVLDEPKKAENPDENDGLVWISDGKVFVRNEKKSGMPPLINPCEGVKLYINGVEYNHLTVVSEQDTIELIPVEEETDNFKMDVEISEDKLKAYANYIPPKVVKNVIIDSNPINKLDIQVTQVKLETKKTTVQQLIDYLNACGIVSGINVSMLDEICANNSPGKFLVAEGSPAQEAVDDRIECFFNEKDTGGIELKENEQGKINFKNILNFAAVKPGEVIAQLHKGKDGIGGIAVDGSIIAAGRAKRLKIMPTLSIKYDDGTGTIKAARMGRPSMKIKGDSIAFHIYDTISVDEVSIKTGNIKFKGDIEVKRNVYESMEVIARQNVFVKGNVNFASIFAGNSVTVKGAVISSKINAAMNDMMTKDPAPLMERIIDGISRLIENIKGLSVQDMAEHNLKDIPDVIRYLLNGKNKDLPGIVYEVLNSLRKGNYDIEEEFILEFMKNTRPLMGIYSGITDVRYLEEIVSNLKELFTVKDMVKNKGSVVLSSVLNSDVVALGDITVSGKGSFNSRLYCNGKVTITGNVIGGQISAGKGIDVNIVGSDMGVKTLLAVPQNSYINIKLALADTTMKIGGVSHTFLSEKRMVQARLVNGKFVF